MKIKITIILAILFVAALGAGIYHRGVAGDGDTEPEDTTEERIPTVRTARVSSDTIERIAFVTGTVEPDFSSEVIAEVSGEVEQLRLEDGTPVEEGLEVDKGERLALVDRKHQRAALREAKARLEEVRSALREAEVQKKDAEREKRRMVSLYEKGSVTEREKDQAVTAYESAEARIDLSEKRIDQAEAAVESARIRYEDATKTAPISGIISRKFVDEGSYVSQGSPIVRIVNVEYVEVKGALAERHLPLLAPGRTPARLRVDAYPGEAFDGKVDRVQPELDALTRTVEITIRLHNKECKLVPGMFARAEIITKRREDVPVVPDAAVFSNDEGEYVFVISEGRALRRKVRTGLNTGDRVEIKEGVDPGETVALRGRHLLEDGLEVKEEVKE